MAHVCACTGWTWDYVYWNVDLPRLKALNAYWLKQPPAHILLKVLAQDMRLKPDAELGGGEAQNGENNSQELAGLLAEALANPIKLNPNAVRDGTA